MQSYTHFPCLAQPDDFTGSTHDPDAPHPCLQGPNRQLSKQQLNNWQPHLPLRTEGTSRNLPGEAGSQLGRANSLPTSHSAPTEDLRSHLRSFCKPGSQGLRPIPQVTATSLYKGCPGRVPLTHSMLTSLMMTQLAPRNRIPGVESEQDVLPGLILCVF